MPLLRVLSAPPGPINELVILLPVPVKLNALITSVTRLCLSFAICSLFLCRASLYLSMSFLELCLVLRTSPVEVMSPFISRS